MLKIKSCMLYYILTMGIWQLINLVLVWAFFGFLASHIAKRRGRDPRVWFLLGFILSVFGVVLVYVLPSRLASKRAEFKPQARFERSDAWMKMWYYQDPATREQKGPIEFPELAKTWKEKALNDSSLVWGEGMAEWKPLAQLPDIKKELETSQK